MNERIRELRKSLGLTMEKFGDRLGVKKNSVSQWENGINNITDQMFKSICREFNVNEDWLRNGTGEMFSIPEDETAALVSELLENPDDEFYQMILNVVHTYQQLKPDSKEVLNNFCRQLAENTKNRKD
ncbi:MAG: helix-turn-helix transcriptional regulator [Clostridiales bacterium]|nr:helix-turn-helix domain-containing protein [Roseburia sp.]MDD7637407.1 helix-turn-helix transcriptional regulator [Clostridiales bacterium]MDY4111965.1 helix-turn-helix transcriptional regulator [Roseburia sp.]